MRRKVKNYQNLYKIEDTISVSLKTSKKKLCHPPSFIIDRINIQFRPLLRRIRQNYKYDLQKINLPSIPPKKKIHRRPSRNLHVTVLVPISQRWWHGFVMVARHVHVHGGHWPVHVALFRSRTPARSNRYTYVTPAWNYGGGAGGRQDVRRGRRRERAASGRGTE